MLFFGNRAETLKGLFSAYVADLRDGIRSFESFFLAYSKGVQGDALEELAGEVRDAESRCDTNRREIQKQLAAGAFLPDFRSDIFDLIDHVDRVPNQMEDIVVYVSIANTPFPISLSGLFAEIVQRNIACVRNLTDALELLLIDLKASTERAKTVEVEETEIDTLERELYRGIFRERSDTTTPGRKLLLKEFVRGVCAVSNRAEDAADRIELLAIKRRA
jgi:predicted phosphate transport protein (TIGR00153 family)